MKVFCFVGCWVFLLLKIVEMCIAFLRLCHWRERVMLEEKRVRVSLFVEKG